MRPKTFVFIIFYNFKILILYFITALQKITVDESHTIINKLYTDTDTDPGPYVHIQTEHKPLKTHIA